MNHIVKLLHSHRPSWKRSAEKTATSFLGFVRIQQATISLVNREGSNGSGTSGASTGSPADAPETLLPTTGVAAYLSLHFFL